MKIRQQRGVTLIELLITVIVVAILAGVALPGYRQYVIRAQRADAKTQLQQLAAALERCFTRFNAYNHADCAAQTSLPRLIGGGRYQLQARALTAANFTIAAVPQGAQTDDTECRTLTLTSANVRGVTDGATRTAAYCWEH
ncbi:MAG: type IV pilin protein [Steroidobacteraceae bacterium]|nr:type IV pilin protein [Steroidobacteraceae bacterium]MDW8259572.1 type IV pilin protein [Gammaproteobacteria bacterium]